MIQNLEALGKGVYKAIVVRSLSVVVVLMLPITLTCITFDWLLRTTQEFRWMVLVLWFTGVLFLLYHTVLPAIRCRINTLTIAHLVERKVPQLKGQLVSGVELSQSPTTPTHTKALEVNQDFHRFHRFQQTTAIQIHINPNNVRSCVIGPVCIRFSLVSHIHIDRVNPIYKPPHINKMAPTDFPGILDRYIHTKRARSWYPHISPRQEHNSKL